jgi:2'-5' RNA ligase
MTTSIRRQLTLFLSQDNAEIIEKVRQKFNPKQFELIKAHITLCREDELENIDQILQNLIALNEQKITIQFEKLTRFDDGKGVYLLSEDTENFNKLRQKILTNVINEPKKQIPHITLMHPRNATCNDEIFEQISKQKFPLNFTFNEISLIEQKNEGKWEILKSFVLTK